MPNRMSDGVPVKKRWKIDFSSVCSKNVVSFSKATPAANPQTEEPVPTPEEESQPQEHFREETEVEEVGLESLVDGQASQQDDEEEEEEEEEGEEIALGAGAVEDVKEEFDFAETKEEVEEFCAPQETAEVKEEAPADPLSDFQRKMSELDLDDPSSPPLMVSKPEDMKPRPRGPKKKKKAMITIQTYNSGSEEEPEVENRPQFQTAESKIRPQRRSKPSMSDLRDQHRVFNTTSFVKESRPELLPPPHPVPQAPVCPPPEAVPVPRPREEVQAGVVTSSSDDTEDSLPLSQFVPKKLPSPDKDESKLLKKVKKRKLKKKKKDPQEPQKPVSAYALFFRDMQSSIKADNPEASFGEISKIVANQWDALEGQKKTDYKKKTESAKKDYLKRLAAYKANKISSEPYPETAPASTPAFVPPAVALTGHVYPAAAPPPPPPQPEPVRAAPPGEYQPTPRIPSISSVLPSKPGICVNDGCTNLAIEDNRWDREYCSTECVVQHCRDAFQSWVIQRQDYSGDATAIY